MSQGELASLCPVGGWVPVGGRVPAGGWGRVFEPPGE